MDAKPELGQVVVPIDHTAASQTPSPAASAAVAQPAASSTEETTLPAVSASTLPPDQASPASSEALPTSEVGRADLATGGAENPRDDFNAGNDGGWQYDDTYTANVPDDVAWTTAEFADSAKSVQWYALLGLAALAIAGIDYFFLMRDILSVIIIIFAVLLFAIYAGRKPHALQYHLSSQGLQVGDRLYNLQGYRAFSVTEEGSHVNVFFAPLARFAPPLTIYVAPDVVDQVLDYLSDFLPFEEHKTDAVDSLMRRIRF